MAPKPITYDDWLSLSEDEQDALHRTWNPYAGENIHIPKEAARRLKATSPFRVFGTGVGVFHGGIYILSPVVSAADLKRIPKPLEQRFDGFLVFYGKWNRVISRLLDSY